jgi:hypothetical protein
MSCSLRQREGNAHYILMHTPFLFLNLRRGTARRKRSHSAGCSRIWWVHCLRARSGSLLVFLCAQRSDVLLCILPYVAHTCLHSFIYMCIPWLTQAHICTHVHTHVHTYTHTHCRCAVAVGCCPARQLRMPSVCSYLVCCPVQMHTMLPAFVPTEWQTWVTHEWCSAYIYY